jgi:hypothetical protein
MNTIKIVGQSGLEILSIPGAYITGFLNVVDKQ